MKGSQLESKLFAPRAMASMSQPCHGTQVHDGTGLHFEEQKYVETIT